EKLLQSVWQQQRLLRHQLKTLDGRSLRILHPGFISREGGPDFRGAVIQLDDGPPRTGDVEVDLQASGWHAHAHDQNPAFKNVILHVIWDGQKSAATNSSANFATLVLRGNLDSPLAELGL